MKVGDIVVLAARQPLDKATGLIVEYLADGYKRHSLGVLWSNTGSSLWDNRISWHSAQDLEVVNESR